MEEIRVWIESVKLVARRKSDQVAEKHYVVELHILRYRFIIVVLCFNLLVLHFRLCRMHKEDCENETVH